ncbi:MAG TPA: glutaredoxin [Candidatus Methylacidiphilales bacterium]
MSTPKIVAYLKPTCGWSQGVRAVLAKYSLPYEDKDIINFPENRAEMMAKSGQPLSPCVEVDGKMLADISGEELEAWLVDNQVVGKSETDAGVPLNQPCAHEMIPASASVKINF